MANDGNGKSMGDDRGTVRPKAGFDRVNMLAMKRSFTEVSMKLYKRILWLLELSD
jgi:hypothetical protein